MSVSASEARRRLFPLIEQVNEDHAPVEINSKHGDAVLVSREDWDSLQETAYLFRSPANARLLMQSLAEAERGELTEHELNRS
jgi:antitoxin YefM